MICNRKFTGGGLIYNYLILILLLKKGGTVGFITALSPAVSPSTLISKENQRCINLPEFLNRTKKHSWDLRVQPDKLTYQQYNIATDILNKHGTGKIIKLQIEIIYIIHNNNAAKPKFMPNMGKWYEFKHYLKVLIMVCNITIPGGLEDVNKVN